MINVIIDEFTPCLKDAKTGELVQTEVIRIKRKTFLRKYNRKTGWYINWASLITENEIYALVVEGSVDIQGLVAVAPDKNTNAPHPCRSDGSARPAQTVKRKVPHPETAYSGRAHCAPPAEFPSRSR